MGVYAIGITGGAVAITVTLSPIRSVACGGPIEQPTPNSAVAFHEAAKCRPQCRRFGAPTVSAEHLRRLAVTVGRDLIDLRDRAPRPGNCAAQFGLADPNRRPGVLLPRCGAAHHEVRSEPVHVELLARPLTQPGERPLRGQKDGRSIAERGVLPKDIKVLGQTPPALADHGHQATGLAHQLREPRRGLIPGIGGGHREPEMRPDRRRLIPRLINRERRHTGRPQPQSATVHRLRLDSGEDPMLALGDASLLSIHHLPQPVAAQADRRDGGRRECDPATRLDRVHVDPTQRA